MTWTAGGAELAQRSTGPIPVPLGDAHCRSRLGKRALNKKSATQKMDNGAPCPAGGTFWVLAFIIDPSHQSLAYPPPVC